MKRVTAIAILTLIFLGYNNCARRSGFHSMNAPSASDSSADTTSPEAADINDLKNPKPDVLCGEAGYSYLMTEYLYDNCVGCHAQGGLAQPPMADKDLAVSYQAALMIPKDKFLKGVTENSLCGDCNLKTSGEVYQALEEWIDNRFQTCTE